MQPCVPALPREELCHYTHKPLRTPLLHATREEREERKLGKESTEGQGLTSRRAGFAPCQAPPPLCAVASWGGGAGAGEGPGGGLYCSTRTRVQTPRGVPQGSPTGHHSSGKHTTAKLNHWNKFKVSFTLLCSLKF